MFHAPGIRVGANQAVDAQELAAIFGIILIISGPAQASLDLLRLITTLGGFASKQLRWKLGRVRCLVRAIYLFGHHLRSAGKASRSSNTRGKNLQCDASAIRCSRLGLTQTLEGTPAEARCTRESRRAA